MNNSNIYHTFIHTRTESTIEDAIFYTRQDLAKLKTKEEREAAIETILEWFKGQLIGGL